MAEEEEGQFLGQIKEIKLPLEKIVLKMGVGRSQGGQNHTRKGRVFLSRGLFVVVRMTL